MSEPPPATSVPHLISLLRSSGPLLVSLAIAVATSLLLANGDMAAAQARARQASGLTRGSIEDRNGAPLAFTENRAGRPVRHYTDPSLAPSVGYVDSSGRWHGVEKIYDNFLSARGARKDWRTFFLNLRGQSAEGNVLRLTLDKSIQTVADRALGDTKGAVVALDPRNGDVLAMVSRPSCSPQDLARAQTQEKCSRDPDKPLLDRATSLLLPPGSAFKIVTLSAAIDSGHFHLGDVFSGADAFGPSPYFDNETYPSNITRTDLTSVTLSQALAFSDNFVFAHIGLTLGAPTLLNYAHRFHVGRKIPFIYPVQQSVIANGDANPSKSVLAQSSFGGTTDKVTPLQMALVASAVANKGRLMAPNLVKELRSASGDVIQSTSPTKLGDVMSPRTAHEVTDGMVFVVNHGSGYLAQIKGMKVAGKTGTAASGGYFPHAWFICFAPAYHPVVAVAVLHEFSGEGFKYAAPIARKVLIAALTRRGFHVS